MSLKGGSLLHQQLLNFLVVLIKLVFVFLQQEFQTSVVHGMVVLRFSQSISGEGSM